MENLENTLLRPLFCDYSQLENTGENSNGFYLNNVHIPEEILFHILTFLHPKQILKCSLVCHNWNKFIKSNTFWSVLYRRKYNDKPKPLPWYLIYCHLSTDYFNNNLLQNGNGQDGFDHWHILRDGGDKFLIEKEPIECEPLPLNVPEFNDQTSCFATSYYTCRKLQKINMGNSGLFQYILNAYKPHIYFSEWIANTAESACVYRLQCEFIISDTLTECHLIPRVSRQIPQGTSSKWEKIEMLIKEYPENIEALIFEHEGCNTEGLFGHYGTKMAGGVVKILFDSIEPLPTDKNGKEIPKVFSELQYDTNGDKKNNMDMDFFTDSEDDDISVTGSIGRATSDDIELGTDSHASDDSNSDPVEFYY